MHALAQACTFLFVPGHQPERFDKALNSGAEAVILDLEDAVPLAHKALARQAISSAWSTWSLTQRARVLVRMNALNTQAGVDDLSWLATLKDLSVVMVSKTESPADVMQVAQAVGPHVQLIPLIETALGVRSLDAVSQSPHVLRLALGHLDLQADLGMACDADEVELGPIRLQMVMASRCAALPPPIDGVTTNTQDMRVVHADALRSRRYGFFAKLCIHPNQLSAVRDAFAPSEAQQIWASRVLSAEAAAGGGAFTLDGKMVDPPVIRLAQQILSRV